MRISFTVLGIALIGLASCERNTGEIGLDFVDQNALKIGKLESVSVVSYTEPFDSLFTMKPSFLMLGSYVDPVFGEATASFATQIILSTIGPDFGDCHGGFRLYVSAVRWLLRRHLSPVWLDGESFGPAS